MEKPLEPTPRRIMLSYWGRRGAATRLSYEVARAAFESPLVAPIISVSRNNESFSDFSRFGTALLPVDTFENHSGAAALWRVPQLRNTLASELTKTSCEAIIELMPHVWSPLVMPAVKRAGTKYITVIHDIEGHLGDRTGILTRWLLCSCVHADRVITLSRNSTDRLIEKKLVKKEKIVTLFHPSMTYGTPKPPHRRSSAPLRLLFLGRILPYKGLPLFIEMMEQLRQRGVAVEAGVFGSGDLEVHRPRLERLGAEVSNRWLTEAEISDALERYDVVVLSHVEASQSGVVAAAHGAYRPVIVTPVGGLVEQVQHWETGLIAKKPQADCLAEAVMLLATNSRLYDHIAANIMKANQHRSTAEFLQQLLRSIPS